MKILSVEQIREADAYTIRHEPIADIDLMERAAGTCVRWIRDHVPPLKQLLIFCGTGNNGGDGLAAGRMLAKEGYTVRIFIAGEPGNLSESSRINYGRLRGLRTVKCSFIKHKKDLPEIDPGKDVVIDALFGSGLARPVTGFHADVIGLINRSCAPVIAIDVPSGLYCDRSVGGGAKAVVVHATDTLTFAPPKLAFFFAENDIFTGEWHLLEIGIHKTFIEQAETPNFLLEREECSRLIRRRNRFSHKGTFGHALLVSGSLGKMGAAVLSARACLRSGPGLVTVHVPGSGNTILQTAVPEAMLDLDPSEDLFTALPALHPYSAIAAGPGLGMAPQTQKALKLLIQESPVPLILDADAINILGENKTWIPFIPKGSIFTPHPKEFERLAGKSSGHFDRNRLQREFSARYGVFVVLKGAFTAITTPEGNCYFNPTGNPGMATGGSGDVLTGIIAGLKAQGYSSLEACLLGVYLHGLAGDLASELQGQDALIAGDIIGSLGKAFKSL